MTWRIEVGDCRDVLRQMPVGSVHTVITSPPYFGLRDYGTEGQIGLEPTPDEFVADLVAVFDEVRRVLRDNGTVWLNLGDSYASAPPGIKNAERYKASGLSHPAGMRNGVLAPETADKLDTSRLPGYKPKDLLGIPWMVAFALRADGWYLRSDIVWSKPNPMPESVTDRPTKAHEYVFLLSKRGSYYFDADAIREAGPEHPGNAGTFERNGSKREAPIVGQGYGTHRPDRGDRVPSGRNKRSVWTVATQPYAGAHFATFPPKLIEPCILAGAPERACGECGAPWVRVVEVESRPNWQGNGGQKHDGTYYRENIGGGVGNDRRARTDRGFEPSCSHGDGSARGVVLDPFAGAGTTGLVALQHGREFVGIELNPEYAAMARERIETAVRLGFRAPQNGAKVTEGQESLFG